MLSNVYIFMYGFRMKVFAKRELNFDNILDRSYWFNYDVYRIFFILSTNISAGYRLNLCATVYHVSTFKLYFASTLPNPLLAKSLKNLVL